ncbi:hypothetical protein Q1695_007042 [Nippostrongylus brasiliensis]|nr:hypothetical protein Q1695_007042 [Nippostrongylus brasiliensis]
MLRSSDGKCYENGSDKRRDYKQSEWEKIVAKKDDLNAKIDPSLRNPGYDNECGEIPEVAAKPPHTPVPGVLESAAESNKQE